MIKLPLKEGKEKIFKHLESAINSDAEVHSWEFSLDEFPEDGPMEDIAQDPYFKSMFDVLSAITENPCSYQFDLIDVE